MILATQISTMSGPVGDPWIWAYPQHRKQIIICITGEMGAIFHGVYIQHQTKMS